jgi:hypothetical protein
VKLYGPGAWSVETVVLDHLDDSRPPGCRGTEELIVRLHGFTHSRIPCTREPDPDSTVAGATRLDADTLARLAAVLPFDVAELTPIQPVPDTPG